MLTIKICTIIYTFGHSITCIQTISDIFLVISAASSASTLMLVYAGRPVHEKAHRYTFSPKQLPALKSTSASAPMSPLDIDVVHSRFANLIQTSVTKIDNKTLNYGPRCKTSKSERQIQLPDFVVRRLN